MVKEMELRAWTLLGVCERGGEGGVEGKRKGVRERGDITGKRGPSKKGDRNVDVAAV